MENKQITQEETDGNSQNVETNKTETGKNVTDKKKSSPKEAPVDEKETEERVSLDTSIFFHFTLFLIWSLVTALCVPSVLTWAHNFR